MAFYMPTCMDSQSACAAYASPKNQICRSLLWQPQCHSVAVFAFYSPPSGSKISMSAPIWTSHKPACRQSHVKMLSDITKQELWSPTFANKTGASALIILTSSSDFMICNQLFIATSSMHVRLTLQRYFIAEKYLFNLRLVHNAYGHFVPFWF